jgi:hypothetical protein
VGNWLTQGWRPQLNALTRDTLLEQQGWIRGGGVSDAVAAAVSAGHVPVQLWTLIVLENWLRTSRTPAGVGAQR